MKRGIFTLLFPLGVSAVAAPIPVAQIKHPGEVQYETEVLPFLNDNCLACHCKTTTKGGLNLETRELILKGGDTGPALVPGQPDKSLLMTAATHADPDTAMPPRDNKAKAKNLSPEQLALLKLWIQQGAKIPPRSERVLKFQPIPAHLKGILAVAVTGDGQFAACARSNQLFVYHLPTTSLVFSEAVARDQISSLAFSRDGKRLAAGSFREVKLWGFSAETEASRFEFGGSVLSATPDGKWLAAQATPGGVVQILNAADGKVLRNLAEEGLKIRVAQFSPDGRRFATASDGRSLAVWSVDGSEPVQRVEVPAELKALVWTADGSSLLGSGEDAVVRRWNVKLEQQREWKASSGVQIALHTTGIAGFFASGAADGTVCVWSFQKEEPVAQIKHGAALHAFAVRGDGKRYATAGADALLKIWDEAGKLVSQQKGSRFLAEKVVSADLAFQVETANHEAMKTALKEAETFVTKAGERLKKAEGDLELKRKKVPETATALQSAKAAKETVAKALEVADAALKAGVAALEAADKNFASASAALEKVKAANPAVPAELEAATKDLEAKRVEKTKASTEKDQLAAKQKAANDKSAPADQAVTAAEDAHKKAEQAVSIAENEAKLSKTETETAAKQVKEAKEAVARQEAVRNNAEVALTSARKVDADGAKPFVRLAFSPDGMLIAALDHAGKAYTWAAASGSPVGVFGGVQDSAAPAANVGQAPSVFLRFADDGKLMISANGHCSAWSLGSRWTLERQIGGVPGKPGFVDRVNALAFSPDGKILATGGGEPSRDGEIKLWDPSTGAFVKEITKTHSDTVFALEYSPDGKQLASGGADRVARLLDPVAGTLVRTFEGHTGHVLGVNWSADGRQLATAGADNVVKVWEVSSGQRKRNVDGYDKEVTSVRFVGLNGNLVTSSGDNKVRLVGADGKEVRSFPEAGEFLQAVAVTGDGKRVLAGGHDSVLRIWNVADGVSAGKFTAP